MFYSFKQIGTNVPPERHLLVFTGNLNAGHFKGEAVQQQNKY